MDDRSSTLALDFGNSVSDQPTK